MDHDFGFDRCNEVQNAPNGHLDLWFRGGWKSSIISFGLTLQDILNDPEQTIGIFSHTRPQAKTFLRQIMYEMEGNEKLRTLFPDIIWDNPQKDSPKWSEDDGIIVKRRGNPREATVEAWGLIDGMPTGKHFGILVYDDIITEKHVTNPDQIKKAYESLRLSFNLCKRNAAKRFIGTRYHYNDPYGQMIEEEIAIPRIYPGTKDGTIDGESWFLTREELEKKRKELGPYIFCFPSRTPILMADWTEKNIEDIRVGDEVIGYIFPKGKKSGLVKTKVLSLGGRIANVSKFTFESGRTITCTPDHKFYTGRRGTDIGGTDCHNGYATLGFTKWDVQAAIPVYDPRTLSTNNELAAAWLSGLWDGEGSCSASAIHISQSPEHNPEVCEKIEWTLKILGFDYGTHERAASNANGRNAKSGRIYYLRGGRAEKIRFLNICKPARKHKLIASLNKYNTRNFGKVMQDKLVLVEPLGETDVYNIETETGNYIAAGYAVKNSAQIQQNPVADEAQNFKEEWLRYYDSEDGAGMSKIILVDSANAKKRDSDYTAIWVIGLGSDENLYALDLIWDRINLTQRASSLIELHRKWKPIEVRYERYGMMADIEHIKTVQEREHYRFDIREVGGSTSKDDRIKRLLPYFEQHRIYLPATLWRTLYDGKTTDLIKVFVQQEFKAFPVSKHKDLMDSLSRIAEPDLPLPFPESKPRKLRTVASGGKLLDWMAS